MHEEETENEGTYTVETQTPLYTLDWHIKWISSIFILMAVVCRSVTEIPYIFDMLFSLLGTIGWFIVGFIWHDRAIILMNGVLFLMLTAGILRYFL